MSRQMWGDLALSVASVSGGYLASRGPALPNDGWTVSVLLCGVMAVFAFNRWMSGVEKAWILRRKG